MQGKRGDNKAGRLWNSLVVKIAGPQIAVLLLSMGLAGTLYLHVREQNLLAAAEREALTLSELTSGIIAERLLDGQRFEIDLLLEGIARNQQIARIRVVDPSLTTVAKSAPEIEDTFDAPSRTTLMRVIQTGGDHVSRSDGAIIVYTPITSFGVLVGGMEFAYDIQPILANIDSYRRSGALGLLMLLAGLAAFSALLTRGPTRRIQALTADARAIASGDWNRDVGEGGTGEISDLQNAFRTMLGEIRSNYEKIERLAFTDEVTGISNRAHVLTLLGQEFEGGRKSEPSTGQILFIDLDRFKLVNDLMGHDAGDEVLRKVAARFAGVAAAWQKEFGHKVHVARLGGDEFTVFVPGATAEEGQRIANRITSVMEERLSTQGQLFSVGASIGICSYPRDGDTLNAAIKAADLAMYAAKTGGRGHAIRYTPELAEAHERRSDLQFELAQAIRSRTIETHFQPKFDAVTGKLWGAEALARWVHPVHGNVPAQVFLDIAEETGLIVALGDVVFEQAIHMTKRCCDAGHPVRVAVNATASQVFAEGFAEMVAGHLKDSGLPAELLEVEINEHASISSPEALTRSIQPLLEMGVSFAVDDFGTGYSNLGSLSRLPVNTLKFDRSLVQDIGSSSRSVSILRSIAALADALGLETVAEGIETPQQLDFMRELGTNLVQGYLYSRAVAPEDYLDLVASPSEARTFAGLQPQ